MTNPSIYAAFERMWQHILLKLEDYATITKLNESIAKHSGLPEVTEIDNGSFLRVVNGEWATSVVPSAEEVSF